MLEGETGGVAADLDVGVALYATDRLDEHYPARLIAKRGDFLVFRLRSQLKRGRKLITEDGDQRTSIQVTYCRQTRDGGYELGCEITSTKEGTVRREWRLPADIPAQVTIVGETAKYKAKVVNISPSGLGIEIPIEVPAGAELIVQMRDGSGYGDVRHCRKVGRNKYYAGLFIQEFLDAEPVAARGLVGAIQTLVKSLKRLTSPAYTRSR
ncbi:MAG: PilZ domain-containing protein [Acidobacteriaceae bacterium]|nr:PilZ domain-containing protein [Acidobacteriaceae bacterium]